MKILIHDYAGHAFPTALSRQLAARGHQVAHTFASNLQTPRGDLCKRKGDAPGLEFHEIPMDPEYTRFKYRFLRRRSMEVRYGRRVGEFIRQWNPEVVLSGNTPTEVQEHLVRASRDVGADFHYWLQDFYSIAVDRLVRRKLPVIGAWIGKYYRFLEGRQFRRSKRVVAITGDFTPILDSEFRIPAQHVEVVPNWALIEEIPSLPKDNAWARTHDLHDKFVFLYSGTIGMKHNPGLLLDLARSFRDRPEVRVLVVSEGIGADWLREHSADVPNLLLMPYQPFAELPQLLATGDVLVGILEPDAGVFSVPSKTLSYLCAARPLLLAIPPENLAARITRDENAGLTVAPDDTAGFLHAAQQLFSQTNQREAMGRNARDYAERTFSIGPICDRFSSFLSRNS